MPITTVNYQKTYNLGNYSSEKIGIEISLNEGQDPKEALHEAKKLADEFHTNTNKEIYPKNADSVPININKADPVIKQQEASSTKLLSKEEKQKQLIESCTSMDGNDGLLSYKLLVKSYPHLQDTYDNKLKELQNV